MKKLNPDIIRIGDKVKIINPELFVRCGYELVPGDLYEEIAKKYKEQIDNFLRSVFGPPKSKMINSDVFGELRSEFYNQDVYTVEGKIIDALCYYEVKRRKFGGNERKIYTEPDEKCKNKIGIVERIKFVKTGIYSPGYESGGNWACEPEWHPPYLKDETTHKILTVKINNHPFYSHISIESIHVEKVIE